MTTKISQLPLATALDGTELVPIVQGAVTKQSTAAALTRSPGLKSDLASPLDGLGDALVAVKNTGTGGVARTQHDKNTETVTRADFDTSGHYDAAKALLTGTIALPSIEMIASGLVKFDFTTHQNTNFTLGDGSSAGAARIYSQLITDPSRDLVLAVGGIADIHLGNIAGGTGNVFIDTDIRVSAWSNGTRGHGLRILQQDGSASIEFPSSGGIIELSASLRGANGANLDTIFRSGNSAGLWKFTNAANTNNVLTLSDAGLFTLKSTTPATVFTISPDTDIVRIKGGGTANGIIFYGTQGSTGTGGVFRFNNNATDDQRHFQISVTAGISAVNYIDVVGGATTVGPTLSAQGETNVSLNLKSKGTGNVFLDPQTGDVKWGKALVSLGGGATPTLGTIGGSGPATAAQNTWMRVLDSTGAAFWVPAWK